MIHNLPKPGFPRVNHQPTSPGIATRYAASLLPWIAAATCMASQASAQEPIAEPSPSPALSGSAAPTLLQEVVVTASRTDETAAQVTSAYTKVDAVEMERAQFQNVKQAVNLSPGVFTRELGAQGGLTGIAIRGNRPGDTLLLTDGVRSNSSLMADGFSLLSFASNLNLEDVEIIRGAHSSVWGSDAIGGVVALQTKRGSGNPKGMVFFEAGSFNTFREGIISDGSLGALDYSLHFAREDSSNDRPNNDVRINSGSLRLDWTASDKLTLGLTVRTQEGKYQEPGSIRLADWGNNDPNSHLSAESTTISAYAELKATDVWTTKLTLGCYNERYNYLNPLDSGGLSTAPYWDGSSFVYPDSPYPGWPAYSSDLAESTNWTADWQNTFQLTEKNRFVAGLTLLRETGHYESNYMAPGAPVDVWYQSASNVGVYAEDQWEPIEHLTLTGGLRYDHYELAGDAFTYRGGAAYFVESTRTKFRASYGTAFKEPTFYQIYRTALYNGKRLDPERSHSWDAGIDQYLLEDKLALGVTYFHSNTNDLIAWFYPTYNDAYCTNLGGAGSYGVETSLTAKLNDHWQARLAYTWTESEVEARYWTDLSQTTVSGMQRRPRSPRHIISAETNYTFDLPVGKLTLGAGVYFAAQREDIDWSLCRPVNVNGTITSPGRQVDLSDYVTARIYGRYEMNDHVSITARLENAFDEHYDSALGYPARGLGAYGGLEIRF